MNLTRQTDTLPSEILNRRITIIGAGGIGSWTTLALSKLGFNNITVIDDDKVDDVNIPSQVYAPSQVGKPKVEALYDVVKLMTDLSITSIESRDLSAGTTDILIVCVDNMDARKKIAEGIKEGQINATHVVDSRMAIETGMVIPYDLSTVEKYLKGLYTDEEAVQEACTNRAIAYTTTIIAGLIAKTVCLLLKEKVTLKTSFQLKYEEGELVPEMLLHTNVGKQEDSTEEVEEDIEEEDSGEEW